jgi:hypothetical protein
VEYDNADGGLGRHYHQEPGSRNPGSSQARAADRRPRDLAHQVSGKVALHLLDSDTLYHNEAAEEKSAQIGELSYVPPSFALPPPLFPFSNRYFSEKSA